MPAAPLLMVAANVTGVSAAVGGAVASAVVGSTVSAAVASAVGSGLIAAGVTAAVGGDANDILKAAVVGGGSAYLGNVAGAKAGSAAQAAGYSEKVSNVVSAAASGGVENTTQALAYGADIGEALKEGAVGSLAAGATVGTIEAFKEDTRQPGIKIPVSQIPSEIAGVGETGMTPRAENLVIRNYAGSGFDVPADTFLPRSTRADIAAGRAMITPEGDVVPTMRIADGRIVRASLNEFGDVVPYTDTQTASYDLGDTRARARQSELAFTPGSTRTSALGEYGEQILAQYIYPEFAEAASGLVFGNRTGRAPQPTETQVGVESTGTPSSAALAQALRVGDAGEPVFGTDDLGKQKRVWNVSSLKLKDDVGG